jgi:hypothetical protein
VGLVHGPAHALSASRRNERLWQLFSSRLSSTSLPSQLRPGKCDRTCSPSKCRSFCGSISPSSCDSPRAPETLRSGQACRSDRRCWHCCTHATTVSLAFIDTSEATAYSSSSSLTSSVNTFADHRPTASKSRPSFHIACAQKSIFNVNAARRQPCEIHLQSHVAVSIQRQLPTAARFLDESSRRR